MRPGSLVEQVSHRFGDISAAFSLLPLVPRDPPSCPSLDMSRQDDVELQAVLNINVLGTVFSVKVCGCIAVITCDAGMPLSFPNGHVVDGFSPLTPVLCSLPQAVAPMLMTTGGRVVLISSEVGLGAPGPFVGLYGTSK